MKIQILILLSRDVFKILKPNITRLYINISK